jgi:hypothetical protein
MEKATAKYGDKPERFMDGFSAILYQERLQQIANKKKDEDFREQKARQESRFLSKISSILISVWDFTQLISRLQPGETLTVNSNGEIFSGKVDTEKLHKLPQIAPGKNPGDFDTGAEFYLATKSWVNAPEPPLKNSWDGISIKLAPRFAEHPLTTVFMEKLEEVAKRKATEKEVTEFHTVDSLGFSFTEISIKGFPIKLGVSKSTGKARYVIYKGNKIEF